MSRILVTDSCEADLDGLWDEDFDAAAEIVAAIEELECNEDLLSRLHQQKYRHYDPPDFEVELFQEFWKQGLNLYRLKHWDIKGKLVSYRVLYAHDASRDIFFILAVVHRDHAYDPNHPTVIRVRNEYDALGISTY